MTLPGDYCRDVITLDPTDDSFEDQTEFSGTEKCTMPENMSPHKVPVVLPLFGNHEIIQGSIND